MKVSEYLGHWSRESEIKKSSDILEALARLSLYRRNTQNHWQNDEFLETCHFINKLVVCNSLRYFNKIIGNHWFKVIGC